MRQNVFPKSEKICSEILLKELFSKNSSCFFLYPFKVFYQSSDITSVVISVSKRKFKLAHERNLLKRRVRECYRLNKSIINKTFGINIAFVYTQNQILKYQPIEKSITLILQKLASIIQEKQSENQL